MGFFIKKNYSPKTSLKIAWRLKYIFLISSGGGGFGPSFGGSAASAGAQSFNGGGLGGGFSGSAANAQSQSFNGKYFIAL